MSGVLIAGAGMYVPETIVTNDDMAKIVDTSDEWIVQRTGIQNRRFSKGEPNYYMGTKAAQKALENAGVSADEIEMIIGCTCTPDYFYPSLSCIIQGEIGAKNAFCWDLNGACTGFIYALDTAHLYLAAGKKNILIVASEMMTKHCDFTDRSSCVLFGDGAGAVVLKPSDSMYSSYLKSEGGLAHHITCAAIPPRGRYVTDGDKPEYNKFTAKDDSHLYMEGKDVYRFAVRAMPEALGKACEKAGLSVDDLDLIIPHQANLRIIETAVKRLGVSMDKVYVNIDRYANPSSACIPMCLSELMASGKIKRGDKLGLVGFGAGLTYGSAVLEL